MDERWTAPAEMLLALAQRLERALSPPRSTYVPLRVDRATVGWLTHKRAARLAGWPEAFQADSDRIEFAPGQDTAATRTQAIAEVAHALAAEGALTAWRDERYAVAAAKNDPPLFELERAAARYFGIRTYAVHVNGIVGDGDQWRMWLARRSLVKAIDPGLLDNVVGGGLAAGASIAATVAKEAWEEAGIAAELVRSARPAGAVHICREQPDGLQRETIYVHDLQLPSDFVPANQDGEAVEHRLCAPVDVLARIARDEFTADASLVILDFLIRHGHVPPDDPSFAALEALRHPPDLVPHRVTEPR